MKEFNHDYYSRPTAFVPSLTYKAREVFECAESFNSDLPVSLFDYVLITIIAAGARLELQAIQNRVGNGTKVVFDSGGFFVQTGKMRYDELHEPLMKAFLQHQWAHLYTLPDNVPSVEDSQDTIDYRVRETVKGSVRFFQQLPDHLKERALGVIQGNLKWHHDYCLEHYLKAGIPNVGFGTFGKVTDLEMLTNARRMRLISQREGMKHFHLFGFGHLGATVYAKYVNPDTFDSASFMVVAGYKRIGAPFVHYMNISEKRAAPCISPERWRFVVEHTNHFEVADYKELVASRKARLFNNLVAQYLTVDRLNNPDFGYMRQCAKLSSFHEQKRVLQIINLLEMLRERI